MTEKLATLPETLCKKSIHELRVMAQAFGVHDVFEKDAAHLVQEIELKHAPTIAPQVALPPIPVYDARLMTKPPSRRSSIEELVPLLEPYITLGLKLTFDDVGERWFMVCGKRTDEGTMRMPLRHVVDAARRMMNG